MYHEMKELSLFVVAPKGYESFMLIVVAEDKKQALIKAMASRDIFHLAQQGVDMSVSNLSKNLSSRGYTISVQEQGMFH